MGKQAGFEVECTKDGRCSTATWTSTTRIAFYTSGDLTKPRPARLRRCRPPGKKKLLDAIAAGKGFVGFHSATDTFRSAGAHRTDRVDPYIAMIGGEFVTHGPQQVATMTVASPKFPGLEGIRPASFD